jgi:hypothetical protein
MSFIARLYSLIYLLNAILNTEMMIYINFKSTICFMNNILHSDLQILQYNQIILWKDFINEHFIFFMTWACRLMNYVNLWNWTYISAKDLCITHQFCTAQHCQYKTIHNLYISFKIKFKENKFHSLKNHSPRT